MIHSRYSNWLGWGIASLIPATGGDPLFANARNRDPASPPKSSPSQDAVRRRPLPSQARPYLFSRWKPMIDSYRRMGSGPSHRSTWSCRFASVVKRVMRPRLDAGKAPRPTQRRDCNGEPPLQTAQHRAKNAVRHHGTTHALRSPV